MKANPEAAKPIIEKEFLFFIAADLEKLEEEFGAVRSTKYLNYA